MKVNFDKLPQATSVKVFFCHNPDCSRPHVILFDSHGEPMAQFVVPDPRPDAGFMHDLQNALYRSAVERGS
jgi:hypothetical protein